MKMHAIVSSPRTNEYVVRLRYIDPETSRETTRFPMIEIPADSYRHACRIADAFNNRVDD